MEVDGVECQLRVKPTPEKNKTSTSRTNHDRNGKRPPSRSFGDRQTRSPQTRKGSDYAEEDDLGVAFPTAADLAESFLQTEPENEKAELEAALLAETRELGTDSSVMSDDGELEVGTGAALSLPGTITSFLEGMADRLQVRIRDITINLDLEIPNETSRSPPVNPTDPVTVQLRIENVDVEGVTQMLGKASLPGDDKPKLVYKEGKRLISLSNIRGALISEANFFSSLARSSGLSSPSVAHSDVSEDRRSVFNTTISRATTTRTSDDTSDRSSTASSGSFSTASLPRKTKDTRSMGGSVFSNDSGRFDDAPEDDEGSHMADSVYGALSDLGNSVYQNSEYLDQLTESQYLDEDKQENAPDSLSYSRNSKSSIRANSPFSTPRASMHLPSAPGREINLGSHPVTGLESSLMLQSTVLPTRSQRFSAGRVSQSQRSLPVDLSSHFENKKKEDTSVLPPTAALSESEEEEDGASTPMAEQDLAQSQSFSHEDAESMYMSAISHASSVGKVPGGWATSSSDESDEEASPLPKSSALPKTDEDSRDNLEHALQHSPVHTTADLRSVEKSLGKSKAPSISSPRKEPSTSAPQISSQASELSTTSSDEYSRLSKQIFGLDRVDIYVPGFNPVKLAEPEDIAKSTFGGRSEISHSKSLDLPGTFSTHLPNRQAPSETISSPAVPTKSIGDETQIDNNSIEIQIGQLSTQLDISVGVLIFKLMQRFQEALKQEAPNSTRTQSESTSASLNFNLSATKISVLFLEKLEGNSGSTQFSNGGQSAQPQDSDALLRTAVEGLNIHTEGSNSTTKTTVSMKKVAFGYAKENILSFDADLQMRASVRDLKAADGIDVRVNITTMRDITRCEVVTLPMHVSIDLQRLDETFSWFGGLSSVLNLGSSIASNATITSSPSKPKPRGVRFETPIQPDDKSLVSQNKADVRIGGFVLVLVGTECNIGVETSAVKIVSRDEGIAATVQAITLSGPHLPHSKDDPAIIADITSTRVEYLSLPKTTDLDRLIALITPSKMKYDDNDDVLTDVLLRQRKQGPVLRLTVDDFNIRLASLSELNYLPELGEEVAKLATVAKYLPEDERPGLLSLITVRKFHAHVDVNKTIGTIQVSLGDIEVAQITLPSLVATQIATVSVHHNESEEIIGPATNSELRQQSVRAPAIMARMIGDAMDPVVKIRLWNVRLEYRVPTLLTLLGLMDNATPQDLSASLAASVATLTDFARPKVEQTVSSSPNPMAVDLVMRDCILGLNPLGLPSKLMVVLTEAHLNAVLPKDQKTSASLELSQASLFIIDNVANFLTGDLPIKPRRHSFDGGSSSQVTDLGNRGYVCIGEISSAKAFVHVISDEEGAQVIDVELQNPLFVLETCADSTQTLVAISNRLAPPSKPVSKDSKYRTKIKPINDLLASMTEDAFGTAEGAYNFDDDFGVGEGEGSQSDGEDADDLNIDSQFYLQAMEGEEYEDILEDKDGFVDFSQLSTRDTHDGVLLDNSTETESEEDDGELDFQDNYFGTGPALEGTAHKWNSTKNTYDRTVPSEVRKSPLKVRVRDMRIVWQLFDGYDWKTTRDTIADAVQNVESRAIEKRARTERRSTFDQDVDDEDTVIGDFLFNSIYIGIPANRDPRELAAAINEDLMDNATETESVATTYISPTPSRQGSSRESKSKNLRLNRSRRHKIAIELDGVAVDFVAFPPGTGETQSSIDVRVDDFKIIDIVPTSTWNQFAAYMQDAGPRESGASMIHLEIHNVKPIPDLAATEIVLKVTVLPLRLHVDQDALDFITRFFEFKDDSVVPSNSSPGDVPFIQRAEINAIPVKLDFKPKRFNLKALRSGDTTELMHLRILEDSNMVLKHCSVGGISGLDKLGKTLHGIWMDDVQKHQLGTVISGLSQVRSIVNVGEGFGRLFKVTITEYEKDGRVVRSVTKGASAFAKSTGTELVKLGAKVAVGVQTVLQDAEDFLGPTTGASNDASEDEGSGESTKKISLYANQPENVMQGVRGGMAGLRRDLIRTRNAIIAIPREAMEGGNVSSAMRALGAHGPKIFLGPVIGVAKASGQMLMGATNSLDPVNLQRAAAVSTWRLNMRECLALTFVLQKYKKH